jgi:AAA+ ATPase superfamily predicted ATPase
MIIQFKDRKKELGELKEVIDSGTFQLFIIYGRRRIGKTELILNSTKNKNRIYYLATGENNLERFYNACVKQNKEISKLKKDWEVLFDFLKDKVNVIIIDEFQNMIQEDKNILNIFQSIVDTILKNSRMKLFLLGSSVSIMTSKILSYKSPLYGRRSGSINLRPISFFDLKEFFPKASFEQITEIYGFADGIPFYLVKIDNEFWHWLENEIRQEKSFLKDEVDFLVRYEFADAGTYKAILEAIANNNTKLNEIKNSIKMERTDITPYLKNLIEVGFVRRKVPVTEKIKSRNGRYHISDNFLKFWFRYIYPNLSSIGEGIFNANVIKKDYSQYLGFVFEDVCRQFLIKNMPFLFNKIGSWWHKDKEIDIVALNDQTKEILFGECKWQSNVNAEKLLTELKEKAKNVEWNNGQRKEYYTLFAKSFKKRIKEKNLLLFDIKDLDKNL